MHEDTFMSHVLALMKGCRRGATAEDEENAGEACVALAALPKYEPRLLARVCEFVAEEIGGD
jgi:hypothetical protein